MEPLLLRIDLKDINVVQTNATILWPCPGLCETYLWTVFFKVDGESVHLDSSTFHLVGNALLSTRPGDHGDLPRQGAIYQFMHPGRIPITPDLGRYRTVLQPIPIQPPILGVDPDLPGIAGYLAIHMLKGGTDDEDIAAGHEALNTSLQTQIDGLIGTLGIDHQKVTDGDIKAIADAVSNAINHAVSNRLTFLEKLLTFLGLDGQDSKLAYTVHLFSLNDLENVSPKGDQAVDALTAPIYSGTLEAPYTADPVSPRSLRRFMSREGLDGRLGIRDPMSRARATSVREWIATSDAAAVHALALGAQQ